MLELHFQASVKQVASSDPRSVDDDEETAPPPERDEEDLPRLPAASDFED